MSNSSLFTLMSVPLLMIVLTLVERRFGSARAGWVSGYPVVGAPALVILVIEHGEKFGAEAALNGLKGIVGWSAFLLVFRVGSRLSEAFGTRLSVVGSSLLVWLIGGFLVLPLRPAGAASIGFIAYVVVVAVALGSTTSATVKPGWSLLLTRIGLAPLFVLLVVGTSNMFGVRAAGLLTTFPIVSSALLYSSLFRVGPEHAGTMSSSMLVAGPGLATFMLLSHLLLQGRSGPVTSFAGALVGAFAVHLVMWGLVARRSRTQMSVT